MIILGSMAFLFVIGFGIGTILLHPESSRLTLDEIYQERLKQGDQE